MNIHICRWQEAPCKTSGEEAIVRADFWVSLSKTTRHMDHTYASLSRGGNGIPIPMFCADFLYFTSKTVQI